MQSDAFRCVGKRSDTSGNFRNFSIVSDDLGDFWSFFGLDGLFLLMFYAQGAIFIGANNYWVVALRVLGYYEGTNTMRLYRRVGGGY